MKVSALVRLPKPNSVITVISSSLFTTTNPTAFSPSSSFIAFTPAAALFVARTSDSLKQAALPLDAPKITSFVPSVFETPINSSPSKKQN